MTSCDDTCRRRLKAVARLPRCSHRWTAGRAARGRRPTIRRVCKSAHVFGRLRSRRVSALSDYGIGDEKYEKLPQQAPLLSKEPSYYVKNHPIYFSCELEEKILPYVLGLGLEKKSC